jgi:hypothetical protein
MDENFRSSKSEADLKDLQIVRQSAVCSDPVEASAFSALGARAVHCVCYHINQRRQRQQRADAE